jgi:hypothetical protein
LVCEKIDLLVVVDAVVVVLAGRTSSGGVHFVTGAGSGFAASNPVSTGQLGESQGAVASKHAISAAGWMANSTWGDVFPLSRN